MKHIIRLRHYFPQNLLWIFITILFLICGIYLAQPSPKVLMKEPGLYALSDISNIDHTKGTPGDPIHIIEYADFECLHCKEFQPIIAKIMKKYGSNIQWAMRFYPLPQDMNAEKEAEAAECVNELGGQAKFWNYSDTIFARTAAGGQGFALANLPLLAAELGVNQSNFQKCLDSGKFYTRMQRNIAEAEQAGILQLPSIVIINQQGNRQLVSSNQQFSVYDAILNAML